MKKSDLLKKATMVLILLTVTCTALPTTSGYKEIVSRNLKEFFAAGWGHAGLQTIAYEKPSLLNSSYAPLDEGSSDGVWAGDMNFYFNKLNSSEFCGKTFINITIKFYAPGAIRIYPCLNGDDVYCYITPPTTLAWATKEVGLNITEIDSRREIWLLGLWLDEGHYLIDEIRLKHDGNADCTAPPTYNSK